nr:hypothetical protein GCM10020185_44970 [Pseudomonas brassicacearum subsp. brassicacearum]
MIYYYFGSKEQLYVEVLEKLYGDIRTTESRLHLAELTPVDAIRRLVEFTFDHHDRNVDFVRIVCIENIHNAEYVKQSGAIKAMTNTILDSLGVILRRGAEEGVFRAGLEPLDVHLLISSFCFFTGCPIARRSVRSFRSTCRMKLSSSGIVRWSVSRCCAICKSDLDPLWERACSR